MNKKVLIIIMILAFSLGIVAIGACADAKKTNKKANNNKITNTEIKSSTNSSSQNTQINTDDTPSLYNSATIPNAQPGMYFQHGFSQEQIESLERPEEEIEE